MFGYKFSSTIAYENSKYHSFYFFHGEKLHFCMDFVKIKKLTFMHKNIVYKFVIYIFYPKCILTKIYVEKEMNGDN